MITPSRIRLKFPVLLKSADLDDCDDGISYDVESLFTSIPVSETINYIFKRM